MTSLVLDYGPFPPLLWPIYEPMRLGMVTKDHVLHYHPGIDWEAKEAAFKKVYGSYARSSWAWRAPARIGNLGPYAQCTCGWFSKGGGMVNIINRARAHLRRKAEWLDAHPDEAIIGALGGEIPWPKTERARKKKKSSKKGRRRRKL